MSAGSEEPRSGESSGVTALRDYHHFFQNAADPVLVTDRKGRVVDANPAMSRALGYGPDELLGMHVPALYATEEDAERFREELSAGDHVRDLPLRLRRRDGGSAELWFSVTVRRDSHGRVVGYQAIARNVTEERRAARQLQESERHFRDLIENSTDLVIVIDIEGHFTYLGPSLERLLGYRSEEMLGRSAFDFIHPDDVQRARGRLEEMASDPGRVLTEEVRFRHKDGSWRWTEGTGRVLVRDGQRLGILFNTRDITDRHAAQRALSESEESFRNLFDSVTEMIFIQGGDRLLINVNQAACDMLGRSREELVGTTPADLAAPEQDDTLPHFEAVLRGESRHFEWRARRSDGSTLLSEISLTPGRYLGQDVVIGVGRDVTGQRRLEERLLQAQKLEAVGRLAGGVAHDFNNVLTAILGNAQMLLAERRDDETLAEDLAVIMEAAHRASALTRQLLAFGRQQIIRPRIVDLNDVIRHAEKLVRPLLGEARRLELRLADELPNVETDPGQLEQVLLNLVMNAVEATADDGMVRIATTVRAIEGRAGESDAPPGLYVVLRVEDDGAGMTPEVRAQAFEPFYTTKSYGSGLGLSTVYGIVRQSAGHIAIESAAGAGTRCDVLLPVSTRGTGPAGGNDPAAGGGEIVLVVEDEPAVRALALRALARAGYRVFEAADGRAALDLLEREGFLDSIDLMLSDVVMPNMLGTELAARVRELRPALPVVFMSGYTQRGRPELPGGPRAAFLPKPFTPDALLRVVAETLRAGAAGRGSHTERVGG